MADYEKVALLVPVEVMGPPEKVPIVMADAAAAPAREWKGHLCHPVGDCSAHDWSWCCITYWIPCYGFGVNMRRAFNLRAVVQALIFLALFGGISHAVCFAVDLSCPQWVKANPENFPASMVIPKDLIEADASMPPSGSLHDHARGLVEKTFTWSWSHSWTVGGKEAAATEEPPHAEPAGEAAAAMAAMTEPPHGEVHETHEEAVRSFHKDGHNFHDKHHRGFRPPVHHFQESPDERFFTAKDGTVYEINDKCMPYQPLKFFAAVITAALGVAYAAKRRTQMREKFGIAGSPTGDLFSWLCCTACALCQESRTLSHNNVDEGEWVGPMDAPPAMAV